MYESDKRVVLTLDAGGTNFVFSALRSNRQVVAPIPLPAEPDNLDRCLEVLVRGFERVSSQLGERPVAISFAFPGPADYANGIIGDLPNFPAFRGGVALGPYLSRHFGLPVFMENDGNLFALGEALSGALTEVNEALRASGSLRTYRNLLGITLGTGFGAGVVIDGRLLTGDNGCGGDVWLLRNRKYPELLAEESVSIRAVKRVYAECGGASDGNLTPKDIFDIAEGARPGNRAAAIASFRELGTMAGAGITAGQVIKAISSLVGPEIVLLAVLRFGPGQWYCCFPILGLVTLLFALWLQATPITRETTSSNRLSFAASLSLLRNRRILLLFLGIFFVVGVDVSINYIGSKLMVARFDWPLERAKFVPQVYFLCCTAGALIGTLLLARIPALSYYRIHIVASLVPMAGLIFWTQNPTANLVCVGAVGFLVSSIFSVIYSLAFEQEPARMNEISGLMITAVAGGGVVTPVIGYAIDRSGVTGGLVVILLCLLYLVFCAFAVGRGTHTASGAGRS